MQFASPFFAQTVSSVSGKRSRSQCGLTLVEVMIVVAVMGLVLAGVLPAYEESLIRAKIAEGLGLAASYKDIVSQNAVNGRLLNANAPALPASSVVRSIAVANDGVITLTYQAEAFGVSRAASFANGATVTLIPTLSGAPLAKSLKAVGSQTAVMPAKAVVEWSCATESSTLTFGPKGNLPSNFAPPECR
jgi:type IV pilus assembly protein PilA